MNTSTAASPVRYVPLNITVKRRQLNTYQILAIICGVLALILGAIGQYKAGNKDKSELTHEIKNSKIIEKKIPPSVELEFSQPPNLAFTIKNISDSTIAENILVSYGITDLTAFDIKKLPHQPVPIPSKEYNYVNPKMASGPYKVLGNFAVQNHRYFGMMYLNCKGCESLKTYWVYIDNKDNGKSFYAKRTEADTYSIDIARLAGNDEMYFDSLVSKSRRIYLDK